MIVYTSFFQAEFLADGIEVERAHIHFRPPVFSGQVGYDQGVFSRHMRIEYPSVHLQGEIHGIKFPGMVPIKTEVMVGLRRLCGHPGKLPDTRRPAGRDEYGIAQIPVCYSLLLFQLVESHRVKGALEPIHVFYA